MKEIELVLTYKTLVENKCTDLKDELIYRIANEELLTELKLLENKLHSAGLKELIELGVPFNNNINSYLKDLITDVKEEL